MELGLTILFLFVHALFLFLFLFFFTFSSVSGIFRVLGIMFGLAILIGVLLGELKLV